MSTRTIILSLPVLLLAGACADPEGDENNLSNFSATAITGASGGSESSIGISSLGPTSASASASASGSASASAGTDSSGDTDGSATDSDTDTDGTDTDDTDTGVIDTDTDGTTGDTDGTTTDTDGTTGDTDGSTTDDTTGTTGVEFPDDAIFVHAEDGLDSNDGTIDAPKRTIQAGIAAAADLPEGKVYVAEGTYSVDYQNNKYITLVDGVSLYGGYNAADWEDRDPSKYESLIVDQSASGGTITAPNAAVDGGVNVGTDTVVDGFTIQGGGGSFATAVRIKSSSPTFTNNRLLGGSFASLYSYGVVCDAGEPTFAYNDIEAGEAVNLSRGYGVYFGAQCNGTLDGNWIFGGGGSSFTYGLWLGSNSPDVFNNVIHSGKATSTPYGIYLHTSSATLLNNTIVTEATNKGQGIYAYTASPARVENNIIYNFHTCIYENGNSKILATVKNNDLSCVTYAARAGYGGSYHQELAPMETAFNSGGAMASGNIAVPPTFVNPNSDDYHLEGDGVTYCDLSQGGLEQGMLFTLDRDATERTKPWSIGAHELDGACK